MKKQNSNCICYVYGYVCGHGQEGNPRAEWNLVCWFYEHTKIYSLLSLFPTLCFGMLTSEVNPHWSVLCFVVVAILNCQILIFYLLSQHIFFQSIKLCSFDRQNSTEVTSKTLVPDCPSLNPSSAFYLTLDKLLKWLSFFTFKMGMIIIPHLCGYCKNQMSRCIYKALRTVPSTG